MIFNHTPRLFKRNFNNRIYKAFDFSEDPHGKESLAYYIGAAGVFMLGMGYIGVPLYRAYCVSTGTSSRGADVKSSTNTLSSIKPVSNRKIKINFQADTYSSMAWNFVPEQKSVSVSPGETALCFYSAKNPTTEPVIGIATYSIIPLEAAPYFNKIQCFCFEEQRLNPNEHVELPVFFYVDPEFDNDPKLEFCKSIVLSYTFFEAKKARLLIPGLSEKLVDLGDAKETPI